MQVSELHFFSHHTGPPKLALSWQHCCTQAWKFTAVIAGCSLLILFNNSLAKSLKLAVKPTCREYALGSGSPPPPTLSQRSNCKYKDGSLQTARFSPTLLTCTSWVSRGRGGAKNQPQPTTWNKTEIYIPLPYGQKANEPHWNEKQGGWAMQLKQGKYSLTIFSLWQEVLYYWNICTQTETFRKLSSFSKELPCPLRYSSTSIIKTLKQFVVRQDLGCHHT